MKKEAFIYIAILVVVLLVYFFFSSNFVAKQFGGKTTIELKEGEKFINATWKDNNIWIITEKNKENTKQKEYKMKEYSNFGVLEGEVTIKEPK